MGKKCYWSKNGYKEEISWKGFIGVAEVGIEIRKSGLASLAKVCVYWYKEMVEQPEPAVSTNASSLALLYNTLGMPNNCIQRKGESEASSSPLTAAPGFDLQYIAITSKTKRARILVAGTKAKKARTELYLLHVDADIPYAQLSKG